MEMTILILSSESGMAGSTNSIVFLARGLSARGHAVYVGCPPGSVLLSLLSGTGATAIPMRFRGMFDLENMRHIRDLVRIHRIQLINAQSHKDRYTSIFAKWLFRLPVAIVHTRRQPPLSSGGWVQARFFSLATDAIVAVSDRLNAVLVAKGYIPRKVTTIYNGTPASRYRECSQEKVAALRRQLGIAPDDIVIGCVSRKKKQDQLIRALALVPFNVVTLFAGIEPETYAPLALELGIKHTIIYAGLVDRNAVLDYYRLCTCSVACSTTDGFGLTLVESMALGVPVAATRAGGYMDVVTHGKNGMLFEDGDIPGIANAIIQLVTDTALREQCISGGRITAYTTYSMERTIGAYEQLFMRLIA